MSKALKMYADTEKQINFYKEMSNKSATAPISNKGNSMGRSEWGGNSKMQMRQKRAPQNFGISSKLRTQMKTLTTSKSAKHLPFQDKPIIMVEQHDGSKQIIAIKETSEE